MTEIGPFADRPLLDRSCRKEAFLLTTRFKPSLLLSSPTLRTLTFIARRIKCLAYFVFVAATYYA